MSIKLLQILCTILIIIMASASATAGIPCSNVVPKVFPCSGYLIGGDSSPSEACCGGAQDLDAQAAASRPDRQAICGCLQAAAAVFPIDVEKAATLNDSCHLKNKIPIDLSVDCST
ncbi:unnamed protein product [Cuscuta epithymum]|uniref:Bifunctional inhibitor/plant lipid transfer protein/seed storage helical domain-containing protein n=1 Tax=Cuscuta epithymum TaxID=186058 RepID=A0AAV0FYD7_9ASTE|nr:unnamed protein product [Cuscuta epithymum]